MIPTMTCPFCGAPDQEIGKFCEQCGKRVDATDQSQGATVHAATDTPPPPDAPDAGAAPSDVPPPDTSDAAAAASAPTVATNVPTTGTGTPRLVRIENGVLNFEQSVEIPKGSTLLVGRTDPVNGVFPDVDVTLWSRRVRTPDGELYTIHRRQCFLSHGDDGQVRIRDCPEYVGDTLVAPADSGQFRPIPALADTLGADEEGAIPLNPGDRVLMGQGEGMLIFQLLEA